MDWDRADILAVLGMALFALLLVVLAEVNERYSKKQFMYGKNTHNDCRCSHRGYEHSYRTGVCRYEAVIGGDVLRCPCPMFRDRADVGYL